MPVICSALNKELPFSIHTGEREWENSIGKKENVTFTQNTKNTKLSEEKKSGKKRRKGKRRLWVLGPDWKSRDWIEFLILRGEGIKFSTRKINQGNFYRVTNTLITYRKSWALRWSQFKDKRANSHSPNTVKGSSMNSQSRDTESGILRDACLRPESLLCTSLKGLIID